MTAHYVVTYEFDTRAPLTHRGTVAGASGATCVARAMRAAQKALRPVRWSSIVCVLLERSEDMAVTPQDGHMTPEAGEVKQRGRRYRRIDLEAL